MTRAEMPTCLFSDGDPAPVGVINPGGRSSFLLIGDHAGNRVPAALADLGLGPDDLARHIAWDIGVFRLGTMLADALDASFVHQAYSRLVIDCNRDPAAPDAIPPVSDGTPIPGNVALSNADRAARIAGIHSPYQQAIGDLLARRDARGGESVIVSLHSFTPMMNGVARPWQIGILSDGGDVRFAASLLARLQAERGLTVGDNEPYRMDSIDHTVPRHAYPARRPYVEIEIRQDLLADEAGCADWCDRLARLLPGSLPIQPTMPI